MVECEFYNDTLMEAMKDVLIDTWWNVNEFTVLVVSPSPESFNRYMVECEYCCMWSTRMVCESFNRYMVECESRSSCNFERY